MLPSRDEIEAYFESLEEYVVQTISVATPDSVNDTFNRLWAAVTRYPPTLPSLPSLPGLGRFEVPASVPPPPPPPTFWERVAGWVDKNRLSACVIGLGLVGSGVFIGHATLRARRRRRLLRLGRSGERRQVVVVLGGDTPLGPPLVSGLEAAGYIVITSVSTPEAVKELEICCNGYVKALVLDPLEPASVPYFLRSLQSTLSLRFPLHAHGDPHASPSAHPYVHSVISLLTLPPPRATPPPGPLEQLSVPTSYLSYLTATHLLPLQLVQSLLPLFRAAPRSVLGAKKSILFCVPATHAQVGVPFAGAQAMSAAATVRGADVLRREIRAAALTSPSMRDIRVVIADVGAVGVPSSSADSEEDLTRGWTPSERATYGPAVLSAVEHNHEHGLRKPAEAAVFVDALVQVVSGGRKAYITPALSPLTVGLGLGKIRDWIRGDRFSVGAGARTYALASHLPHTLLDTLLNLPHFLLSVRNALIPMGAPLLPPPDMPAPSPSTVRGNSMVNSAIRVPPLQRVKEEEKGDSLTSSPLSSDVEPDTSAHTSEAEADVESNAGESEPGTGVDGSWVDLHNRGPSSVASSI